MKGLIKQKLGDIGLGEIRKAQTGTIHLVFHGKKTSYSVMYFHHTRTYRVFYPWGVFSNQIKKDFHEPEMVKKYIEGLENE